jgi:hypothetical protein
MDQKRQIDAHFSSSWHQSVAGPLAPRTRNAILKPETQVAAGRMTDDMNLESPDEDGRLHLNGIDALTGLPTVPAMPQEEVARRAAGGPPRAEDVGLLRRLWEALKRPLRGLPDDIDPTDVTAAGWAVVLPTGTPDEVRQAIERLVSHRRDRTRVPADRCLILAYRPG